MPESLDKQAARLAKKLRAIGRQEVPRAGSAALNKSAKRIKTRVVRGVSKETKVVQKHIRKKVFIKRSTPRTQKAEFRVYRRDIAAIGLNPRTSRKGVRVAGKLHSGAFINTLRKTGQRHVLKRKGVKRYPVEIIKIPISESVDKISRKVAVRVMRQDYPKLLQHELVYRLDKYKR